MRDPRSDMMFNLGWLAGIAFGFIAGLVLGYHLWS